MNKYEPLWNYIRECNKNSLKLSFDQMENILHFKIDHSFLTYKKELNEYKCKISLKDKYIIFSKS